jgi:hypothetical protein
VVLESYLREVLQLGAVLLHVLAASVAKHLWQRKLLLDGFSSLQEFVLNFLFETFCPNSEVQIL